MNVPGEDLTGGAQTLILEDVASAELLRVQTELLADLVGVPLQCEGAVRAVAGPEGSRWSRIGVDGLRVEPNGAEFVVAEERVGGHGGQEGLLTAVGTAVHQHDAFASGDPTVGGDRRAQSNLGILTTQSRGHLLHAGVDKANGLTGYPGQSRRIRLQADLELHAEATSDRRHDHPHRRWIDPQDPRRPVPHRPRHLGRRLDHESTIAIRGHAGPGLQRGLVLPADPEVALDDPDIRPGEDLIDVAPDHGRLPGHVPATCDVHVHQDLIVGPAGMQDRGIGVEGLSHRDHRGALLDRHVDRGECSLQDHRGVRGNSDDRLSDVADLACGQPGMIGDTDPVQAREGISGEYGPDPGHRSRPLDIEVRDDTARHARAEKSAVKHAWLDHV